MTLDASLLLHSSDELAAPRSERTASVLLVGHEARWFSVEGGGRVDLERFGVARRVLSALVAARLDRPGAGVSTRELCTAVWPGDRASLASLANRLRVTISMLRRVGLARHLGPGHGGYRLSPDLVVITVD